MDHFAASQGQDVRLVNATETAGAGCPLALRQRASWHSGSIQYYVEPRRLAKLGYLDACKEPGKTRERTVYTLTAKGFEALREYARSPSRSRL